MFDFMQPDSHQSKKKKLRSKAARRLSVMLLSTMFIFSSPLAAYAAPATQGALQHKTQNPGITANTGSCTYDTGIKVTQDNKPVALLHEDGSPAYPIIVEGRNNKKFYKVDLPSFNLKAGGNSKSDPVKLNAAYDTDEGNLCISAPGIFLDFSSEEPDKPIATSHNIAIKFKSDGTTPSAPWCVEFPQPTRQTTFEHKNILYCVVILQV